MGACLLAVAFATSALIPLPEARANHPGPAADRYVAIDNSQRVPSNFLDIKASGTALATGDDAQSEVDFPAGFTFDFYDKLALEKITMNANGVLLAGTSCPGDPCYTPNDLTGASGPAYVMAPFWVDQNSGCATTTATIKHQTFDASAPTRGRIWVIQWSDMSLYGNDGAKCTTPLSTYQVQLFEGTDILEFHLKSVSNRDNSAVALAFCQDASVGIRGATTGLSYVWADGCTNAHGGNPVIANRPIRFWKNDVDAGDQVVETVMGQPVSFSLDASDDPKIFTLVSDVPADVGLLSELPSEGALYYNPFSPVTFTPVPGFAGTTSFRYTVSDGFDAPATATVTLKVLDVTPPSVGGLVATANGTDAVDLSWGLATDNVAVTVLGLHEGADGFSMPGTVVAATGAVGKPLSVSASSFRHEGLATETPHCYRLRAVDAAGNEAVSGQACATTEASAPAIAGVSPVSGPSSGGTVLTISGTGFKDDITVSIDGEPVNRLASDPNLGKPTPPSIQVQTPGHAAGPVSIVVTNPDLQASNAVEFTYLSPPTTTTGTTTTTTTTTGTTTTSTAPPPVGGNGCQGPDPWSGNGNVVHGECDPSSTSKPPPSAPASPTLTAGPTPSPSPSPSPTPSSAALGASAPADLEALSGATVDLKGAATGVGPTGKFEWRQTSGPAVALTGAKTASASFVAPDVPVGETEVFGFEFKVTEGGRTATDAVQVLVRGVAGPLSLAPQVAEREDEGGVALEAASGADGGSAPSWPTVLAASGSLVVLVVLGLVAWLLVRRREGPKA